MPLVAEATDEQVTWCSARVWRAVRQALEAAPGLEQGGAHCVGDVLTYVVAPAGALATDLFVARRRYWTILAALQGRAVAEVAARQALEVDQAYCDWTDREYLVGSGRSRAIPEGAVLAVGPDEAVRLHSGEAVVVELHAAMEGFDLTH